MIKKDLVRKNFSKGSETYEGFAIVQKHMANQLLSFLPVETRNLRILEIGSGTGILTRNLLNKYPNSKITVIDISEKMISICKKEFGTRLEYIIDDAEIHEFLEKFDLIVSNATFQWFHNIEKALNKLKTYLNDNGEILFSVFMEGTYKELNESFMKISDQYKYSQNFVKVEKLEKIGTLLKSEIYYENFDSLIDFLKSIKAIGAQSSLENKKVLTKNILKKVEEEYKKNYENIKVSNVLGYVKEKK